MLLEGPAARSELDGLVEEQVAEIERLLDVHDCAGAMRRARELRGILGDEGELDPGVEDRA